MLNYLVIYAGMHLPSLSLKRWIFRCLGMRLGRDVTIASGVILDYFFPELIEIGDNTIVGMDSMLLTHEFLHDRFRRGRVRIGANCLVGARSTILAGVTIGDGSTIAAMSLVHRGTPAGTFAGGVPIRPLRRGAAAGDGADPPPDSMARKTRARRLHPGGTRRMMSPAALSVLVFGIYLASGGLLLLLVPEWSCRSLGLSPPGDPLWVRLSGMFFLDLAFYCIKAAIDENKVFIRWSVTTRPLTILFLGAFVALGYENSNILVFGVIDVAATLWTAVALREGRPAEEHAPHGRGPHRRLPWRASRGPLGRP